MRKHPTIEVPGLGPMDHAWDLLGEWETELEWPPREEPVRGRVTFRSWGEAELRFEPAEAESAGVPQKVTLRRASPVERTDAGGGALEWTLKASELGWRLRATMWPGELFLFVREEDGAEEIGRARARRGAEYYAKKYP